jgi:hypothetical protein
VGGCSSRIGKFAAASRWYERAVAAAQKGGIEGRVNHQILGSALHSVGACFSDGYDFAAARPWFERAVAEKEKAIFMAASITRDSAPACTLWGCFSRTGEFTAALPWYKRAIAAICLREMGLQPQATELDERASAALTR